MMKLLTMLMMLCCLTAAAQSGLWCYTIDDGTPQTNLRETPGGKVVMSFKPSIPYMVELADKPVNGWWRVLFIEEAHEDFVEGEPIKLHGSKKGTYWIHNSMVGFSTRNYGDTPYPLRATPSKKGKVAYTLKTETFVHPVDFKGDWVKVKTGDGHQGWIESVMLCDNPLTTCP